MWVRLINTSHQSVSSDVSQWPLGCYNMHVELMFLITPVKSIWVWTDLLLTQYTRETPTLHCCKGSVTWWHTAVLLYRRLPAAGPRWRTRSFSARQSLSGWRREGAGWWLWGQCRDRSPLSQNQEGTEYLWRGWGSWGRGRSQACVSLAGAPLSSRKTDWGCTEKNRYIENGQAEQWREWFRSTTTEKEERMWCDREKVDISVETE